MRVRVPRGPLNRTEAHQILQRELSGLRELSYEQLRPPDPSWKFLILEWGRDHELASTREAVGPSGTVYQVETEIFWDDSKKQTIRVMVSIDDGGSSAFHPMSDDFIIAPDGSFVGE